MQASSLIEFIEASHCVVYVTFTKTQLNQNSAMKTKKSSMDGQVLANILTKIPQLEDKYTQFIIHRQCDRCHSRFRLMASENLVTPDVRIDKCILFLVFQKSVENIEKLLETYSWISPGKATYLLMADFTGGVGHNIALVEQTTPIWTQIVSVLSRFNARILLRSWEDTAGDPLALEFYLFCFFCHGSPFQSVRNLEPSFVAWLENLLNRVSGHGSSAVVNSNYPIHSTEEIRDCEITRFFELGVTTDCSKNEIFLGILARRLNVTLVPGRFIHIQSPAVLRICVTFCYTDPAYLRDNVRIFITAYENTNFAYCRTEEKLRTPGFSFLWNCFTPSVWLLLCLTAAIIAIVGKSIRFGVEFLALLANQSVGVRRKLWLSSCLIPPLIFNNYYQADVISDVMSPLRLIGFPSIQDMLNSYKFAISKIPSEEDMNFRLDFKTRGMAFRLDYFMEVEALKGLSPSKGWARGELIAKYADQAAFLVDRSRIDFALSVARYTNPNLSCNFVRENWDAYWYTWMLRSVLANKAYAFKLRLRDAGLYDFWEDNIGFSRRFFAKRNEKERNFEPLSLNSSVRIVFRGWVYLMTATMIAFLVEKSWMFLRKPASRAMLKHINDWAGEQT